MVSRKGTPARPGRAGAGALLLLLGMAGCATAGGTVAGPAPATDRPDPRIGLRAGWLDAEVALGNMRLVSATPRPPGFFNPNDPGDFGFANSDLAFRGDLVFIGNFHGFQIYDVSDPARPTLRTAVVCPGGQGDLSVYGDLLFMSVEEPRGRVDCGTQGVLEAVSDQRFRGVRIFDIRDLDAPVQVAAVQTCRGSHTHTLVTRPGDDDHVYVYVSGAAFPRPAAELEGCLGPAPAPGEGTPLFRIEVIRVPLSAPQEASIVSTPRLFQDPVTGEIAGLWPGGDHGPGTQQTAQTDHCHDITTYPAIGLAAGACSGNGILLDISDPSNPVRVDEVVDPNFAYWHSATFNNDGTSVIFTDEWGGGTQARCRPGDPPEWGANAIFRLVGGTLTFASYYKLPVPQTATENCVAHNGSIVPVPGRDIKVQAWYQGGISVLDFTDPENPFEIAFFDRGPISDRQLLLGGHWSAYWYNGHVYASEIARGLDVLTLEPSEHLSRNEIEAASLVRLEQFNPQMQPRFVWPASFVVARAHLDQLERAAALPASEITHARAEIDRIERLGDPGSRREGLRALRERLGTGDIPGRVASLADALERLAQE
jgi:hypothetical protein